MPSKIITYFIEFAIKDWFASVPITICSIWTLAVIVERYLYFQDNRRDVSAFIHQLQRELESTNLQKAQATCSRLGASLAKLPKKGCAF